jgi:hypothetical protein
VIILKRLAKIKLAKTQIPINDEAVSLITDSMANGLTIDIDYTGSGMRNNILPYGWSTSKAGDLLIMCYKSTGEIRSYRYDRVNQLFIEDDLIKAYESPPETEQQEETIPNDYIIPPLPNIDEILQLSENETPDEPYAEAVDILENTDTNIESIDNINAEGIDNTENIDNVEDIGNVEDTDTEDINDFNEGNDEFEDANNGLQTTDSSELEEGESDSNNPNDQSKQ